VVGRYVLPENPTLGRSFAASSPYTLGTGTQPIPTEAMKIIQTLQQTAAAILVFRGVKALSAAAAAERIVMPLG